MKSQTFPARVVSIVSKVFNHNRSTRSSAAEAGWTIVLILICVTLLALFGGGEIVSSQAKEPPALNEALLGGPINPGSVLVSALSLSPQPAQAATYPIPFPIATAPPAQGGTLANGVTWSVNSGAMAAGFYGISTVNTQTWTFDQPVNLRVGMGHVQGSAGNPECITIPAYMDLETLDPTHTWNPVTRMMCGESGNAAPVTTFVSNTPVTSYTWTKNAWILPNNFAGTAFVEVIEPNTPPLQTCSPEQLRATQRYWFFGDAAGLDFGVSGTANPTPTLGAGSTFEGTTVVTDTNGTLQFWSDASTIYNRNKVPMANGTGLLGNSSASQTVAAFPAMGRPGAYFVVTTDSSGSAGTLRYSEVDMSLDGGLGAVTAVKNIQLGVAGTAYEALNAIPNADGTGFWVLTSTLGSPNFLAYEFKGSGPVTGIAVTSNLGYTSTSSGYHLIQVSPDLSQILFLNAPLSPGLGTMTLMSFNGATGQATPTVSWQLPAGAGGTYGADFSPSGDYLYVATYTSPNRLYRYNIAIHTTEAALEANAQIVGSATDNSGHIQRAANGKMYWTTVNNSSTALTVINDPDNPTTPGFQLIGQPISGAVWYGLPQMVAGCEQVDYGDAPASYGTLLANNGPRHGIRGFDEVAGTSPLMLGSTISQESDGQPSQPANVDTDDGVATLPPYLPGGGQVCTGTLGTYTTLANEYCAVVSVTNTGTQEAQAVGWLDSEGDGDFADAGNRSVPINDPAVDDGTFTTGNSPVGTTRNIILVWQGLPSILPLRTYFRFRLTSDASFLSDASPQPTGAVSDGEVEDYVLLSPTAANVSISGRVLTRDGRGLVNARVTLTDLQGNSRTVTTNPFGYYRLDEVPTGETYVLTASAKRYRFDPRVTTVKDEVTDLDFIALE